MSDVAAIIENLDGLDKQRTPGPWKKTHDNVTAGNVTLGIPRSLVARCDTDWSGFKVDMAKASKNARFITALENAWPKLRSAFAAIPQWQPIDTAPVPPKDFTESFYRFRCLLQEKITGRVVEGYGHYSTLGGAMLSWREADGQMIDPEYWMPLPAPKVETPDA